MLVEEIDQLNPLNVIRVILLWPLEVNGGHGALSRKWRSFQHSLFDSMSSTTCQTKDTLDRDHKFPFQTFLTHIVNLTHRGQAWFF